jgi:hypothetical protein
MKQKKQNKKKKKKKKQKKKKKAKQKRREGKRAYDPEAVERVIVEGSLLRRDVQEALREDG